MRFFEVHRFNGFVSNVATAIDISFFKFWDDLSHDKNFEAILAKQRTILHFGDPNPNRNGPRETQDSRKSWNWVCENIQESCKESYFTLHGKKKESCNMAKNPRKIPNGFWISGSLTSSTPSQSQSMLSKSQDKNNKFNKTGKKSKRVSPPPILMAKKGGGEWTIKRRGFKKIIG